MRSVAKAGVVGCAGCAIAALALSVTTASWAVDYSASASASNQAGVDASVKGRNAPKAAGTAQKVYDPDNVRGISHAMESHLVGIEKYRARDYAGALETFKAGITLNPKLVIGYLLAAEACVALNKLEDADNFVNQAEPLTDDRNAEMRSKTLYAIADIKERRRHTADAEGAWKVYAQYVAQHPDAGAHPLTAQTRLSYLGDLLKLEQAYVGVRERIAREKLDGGRDGH